MRPFAIFIDILNDKPTHIQTQKQQLKIDLFYWHKTDSARWAMSSIDEEDVLQSKSQQYV